MRTVILSYVLINAVCVTVIASLWLRNRGRFAGLGLWAGGFTAYFVGTLAMVLRVSESNLLGIVIGYALLIGATILVYMGLERFFGKRGPQIQNVILLVVFIVVDTYFIIFVPNLSAHLASVSLAMLMVSIQSAWLVLRRVDKEIRSIASGIGIVFIASCSINIACLIVFLVFPPDNDFFDSTAYETSQLILSQAIVIALAFSLFLALNRRLIANLERDIAGSAQVSAQGDICFLV